MIYLDNASTTKLYPEVIETITDVLTNYWANPSSNYSIADDARILIENVRQQFADDLSCSPDELIFTASGCESNSLAISGFLRSNFGYDFYYSSLEHASINELVDKLPTRIDKVQIPNDCNGFITKDVLRSCIMNYEIISSRKPFVSITSANSEIGIIQDIKSLAEVVHQYGGIIHCDAVQLFPERQIDVKDWDVDLLSISPQKFHAGRGCGILYVKNGIEISPIIYGSQESHLRGGSYNTPAICAAGKALEITRTNNAMSHVQRLRNELLDRLLQIPGTCLNGPPVGAQRLVNNISLAIEGVNAEKLMTLCDLSGVIIARGSACQSHIPTLSKTLKSIGLTDEQALNTIRITLDEFNTEEEIIQASEIITKLVERIRDEEV